jgi:hypothetical protein
MPELLAGDLVDIHLSETLAREKEVGTLVTGEVLEVRDKAVKVKVRTVLAPKVDQSCRLCEHPLTKVASLAIGYGPDCALAIGITNKLVATWDRMPSPKEMVALERAVTKTVWLPIRGCTMTPAGHAQAADRPAAAKRSEAATQVGLFEAAREGFSLAITCGDECRNGCDHQTSLPTWLRCTASGKELYSYQTWSIPRLISGGPKLLADDMGVGKSPQGIAFARAAREVLLETGDHGPILIVCPANLKLNWADELRDWAPELRFQVLKGYSAKIDPKANCFIINYDILAKGWAKNPRTGKAIKSRVELSKTAQALMARGPSIVVVDESHYIKNPDSQRAMALAEVTMMASYRLPMTGTPIMNRPVELIPILDWLGILDPVFGGADAFRQQFCDAKEITFPLRKKVSDGNGGYVMKEITQEVKGVDGKPVMVPIMGNDGKPVRDGDGNVLLTPKREPVMITRPTFNGASNTEELHRMLAPHMIRRKKREVLDLPPKTYSRVLCEISNQDEVDAYEQEILDADGARKMGMLSKLRVLISQGKQKAAIEWVDTFLDGTDGQLVVFANYRSMQQALSEAFPHAPVIFGGMPEAKRHAAVKEFQTYEPEPIPSRETEAEQRARLKRDRERRLVFCSLKAAAEGITLTRAADELVVDLDYTPARLLQANDRIDRIGQTADKVTIWSLWAPGTMDDTMGATLFDKRVIVGEAIDGVAHIIDEDVVKANTLKDVLARASLKRGKTRAKAS